MKLVIDTIKQWNLVSEMVEKEACSYREELREDTAKALIQDLSQSKYRYRWIYCGKEILQI